MGVKDSVCETVAVALDSPWRFGGRREMSEPMPRIMALHHGAGRGPCRAHIADDDVEPVEDGFADQKVADIEFGNFEQRGDFSRCNEIEAMTGMDLKIRAR